MPKLWLRLWWAACAILLIVAPAWAKYPDDYDPRYVEAVNDTKGPLTPAKIDDHLTTIGNNDHIRDPSLPGNPILMTCFTDWWQYSRSYDGTQSRPKLWSAVAPEMWQFLQNPNITPQNMSLRSKQLLGLPADSSAYFVMEFYVQPSTFRPALDPNITDPVTSLTPKMSESDPRYQWYLSNFSTYDTKPDGSKTPVPWTRAGYTYDWGTNDPSHIGLTEFIVNNQNTVANPIWVRSVISITSYKYYVRATDSFNVSNWCDSIWTGSEYLPVTPGGNLVTIHPGVTVSGGAGIIVSDMASQPSNVAIYNAGTIMGPGVNHDGTPRNTSVQFENAGGTLNNTGTIMGDKIGVLGTDGCARAIVINNTGYIGGSQYAIKTGGGNDQINTRGIIDGKINTGPGDDTINVGGGTITGSIDGGTGTNRLNFNLSPDGSFVSDQEIANMANVNINGGTVQLNGKVAGNLYVANGATFAGVSTLSGSLDNWGTVAPGNGNGIGAIIVRGNYTQNAGSRLVAELSKPNDSSFASDQLNVTGTATLARGGTINLRAGPSNSVFRTNDQFTIITADSGLSDQGAAVTLDSAFLGSTGKATANEYSVTLRRTASFASVATEGNNRAMAAALDADAAVATGAYAGLIDQLLFTNSTAFNASLPQFSPASYLAVSAAADRTTQYLAESTGGYLRNRRAGQINPAIAQPASFDMASAFGNSLGGPDDLSGVVRYCGNERDAGPDWQNADRTRSVWVDPFGVFFGERSSGDHLGFQSNVGGVQFGIDKQFNEHFILGLGGSYDQMHIDTNDQYSAGTTDTFRAGPYATWFNDSCYLDASLTGGFHNNDMGRLADLNDTGEAAKGIYRANDLSLYLGAGRDYRYGAYTVSPLVSLQYIYYRQNDIAESGADGADLSVAPLDAHSLRSRVGGQLQRACQWGKTKIVPQFYVGWAHEYLENDLLEARFLGGVTPFTIDRGGIFRDAGYYGVGLTALPRDHVSVFARYNGEYSSGGHFTAIDLGLMIEY